MTLKDYFKNTTGTGMLSTADGNGRVNAAIYSRPHFIDGDGPAFIMRDRLSYQNLGTNPHAVYLFKEDGPGYKGKRIYLKMTKEKKNEDLIASLQRRTYKEEVKESRCLVFFEVVKERPLVGDGGMG